jgi:hypothetical protein
MCLQFDDKFCQQKEGLAVGDLLSPMVNNMFTEHFEEIALDTEHHKPTKWLIYINDIFVVWSQGPA